MALNFKVITVVDGFEPEQHRRRFHQEEMLLHKRMESVLYFLLFMPPFCREKQGSVEAKEKCEVDFYGIE